MKWLTHDLQADLDRLCAWCAVAEVVVNVGALAAVVSVVWWLL